MNIQEVFNSLTSERLDYGAYWIANKLNYKNTIGMSEDCGFISFSAWISKKDVEFILPKLRNFTKDGKNCPFELDIYQSKKFGNNIKGVKFGLSAQGRNGNRHIYLIVEINKN